MRTIHWWNAGPWRKRNCTNKLGLRFLRPGYSVKLAENVRMTRRSVCSRSIRGKAVDGPGRILNTDAPTSSWVLDIGCLVIVILAVGQVRIMTLQHRDRRNGTLGILHIIKPSLRSFIEP